MGDITESVAKARILFVRGDEEWALLSRKNAEGMTKHGQLEMLGGHVENGEEPLPGLIRELREEERSGALADHVERLEPTYTAKTVDNSTHFLFEIRLPESEFSKLDPDPVESIGFELIPVTELQVGAHWEELTWRTKRIFEAFGLGSAPE
jgi:8-oxo-dGTP pyrophosphatase MutT (NUDIX family)